MASVLLRGGGVCGGVRAWRTVQTGRRGRRPLRMVSRNAVGRATARVAPTEWLVGADDSVRPARYKECGAPKRLSLQGSTDCEASVRTGFAMTGFLHGVRWISWWCVGEGLCPSRTGSASTIFSDIGH